MLNDEEYMRRALQLAANGRGYTSPNPMVGAVIVAPGGRIIGEGWHRAFGGPHAEVNAVRSVKAEDEPLIAQSTIYVTLEPCSHYGKTPPCAKMLVEKGFKRVVMATLDPNPRVSGRGENMLREAGIATSTGVLGHEARQLNKAFMAAHTLGRPFVTLKWAQNPAGYIDGAFSNILTQQIVHQRRAEADVIMIGANTAIADNPRLNVRLIAGRSPRPYILDRHKLVNNSNCNLLSLPDTIHDTSGAPLEQVLTEIYKTGYISVLVEGGARLLNHFLDSNLWDEAFVEVAEAPAAGNVKAPVIDRLPVDTEYVAGNKIFSFVNFC